MTTTPSISSAPLTNHGRSSQIRTQPPSRTSVPLDNETAPVLTTGTASATTGAGGRAVLWATATAGEPVRVNRSGWPASSGNSSANRPIAIAARVTLRCLVSENWSRGIVDPGK
jgi:hypothetical protein